MSTWSSHSGISFIILSFNRKDELARTLDVLSQIDMLEHEIIVVDNASTDGSPEMVESRYTAVRLIILPTNVGIAGWNAGFAAARMPYFFVLDDDSWPLSGCAERCIEVMEARPSCGIVACSIMDEEGNLIGPHDGQGANMRNFIGCGAVIRRALYDCIGGFDSRIFLYVHELEYSIRTLQAGYSIEYCAEARVVHAQSLRNRDAEGAISTRYLYHANKGEFYLFLRFFPMKNVAFRIARMLAGRLAFAMGHGHFFTAFHAIMSGLILGWRSRNTRTLLSPSMSRMFGHGDFSGGFFGPRGLAYRNPIRRLRSVWKGAE